MRNIFSSTAAFQRLVLLISVYDSGQSYEQVSYHRVLQRLRILVSRNNRYRVLDPHHVGVGSLLTSRAAVRATDSDQSHE